MRFSQEYGIAVYSTSFEVDVIIAIASNKAMQMSRKGKSDQALIPTQKSRTDCHAASELAYGCLISPERKTGIGSECGSSSCSEFAKTLLFFSMCELDRLDG